MTPKGTTKRQPKKPAKPYPDFPLFPHATKRWAKKIRQKLFYFGSWAGGAEAALARYLDQRDDLHAGREPRRKSDTLTVASLCNHFLTHKQALCDSGELSPRTFDRYHANCALVVATLGKGRPVDDLRPEDFQALRGLMAKRWGPVALGNEIQMVRSIFRYGDEAALIEKRVRFGPGFRKPSAKTIRQTRQKNGVRMLTAAEIHEVLEHAGPNLTAMILMACNGGLGNSDLALLPIAAIDLGGGWLDYPRAKTAIPRRIPLWLKTRQAIRAVLTKRTEPKDPADAALLFIGPRGESYVGGHKGYRVATEMKRALKRAGIEGRTFYDLRRGFQTVAEGAHDLTAAQSIMGHAPPAGDMSAIYRQRIDDERLRAVTEHVRLWLFGG